MTLMDAPTEPPPPVTMAPPTRAGSTTVGNTPVPQTGTQNEEDRENYDIMYFSLTLPPSPSLFLSQTTQW